MSQILLSCNYNTSKRQVEYLVFDKDTARHKFINPVKAKLDNVEIDFCDVYDKNTDEYIRTEIYISSKE